MQGCRVLAWTRTQLPNSKEEGNASDGTGLEAHSSDPEKLPVWLSTSLVMVFGTLLRRRKNGSAGKPEAFFTP